MNENVETPTPKKSPLGWIAFVIVVLVLGAASFTAIQNNPRNQENQNQEPQQATQITDPIAPATLVYGTWVGNSSEISALNLSTRKITTLASLPATIKKVSILSPNTILYIDEVDRRYHGKKLVIYDLKNKKVISEIPAAAGFGIDDYVISPNKEYVSLWEVAFAENSEIMRGGRSQVTSVKLSNPTIKHIIHNEIANTHIRYPIAILDDGRVFMDKFLPNDISGGAGWAYGLSVSDFDGSNIQDLESSPNGTYSTQPLLSPNGEFLVFAGYDGTKGPGSVLKNSYRQALLTPNTIELIDTNSLERQKLTNLLNLNIYAPITWDSSNNILLSMNSANINDAGYYLYNTTTNTSEKILFPENDNTFYKLISKLSSNKYLIATIEDSESATGDLGDKATNLLKELFVYDSSTKALTALQLPNELVQHITTLPANFFPDVLGVAYAQGGEGNPGHPNVTVIDLYSDKPTQENLQLKTFLLKPELAPVRERQQTQPPPEHNGVVPLCADLARQQCAELGRANDWQCLGQVRVDGLISGKCLDSPLYVYGNPGQKIKVKIHTKIQNESPAYQNGYEITVAEEGKIMINGKYYDSISYDYDSSLKRIKSPSKGTFASKSNVEKILKDYATNLGLNEKETKDLIASGKTKITSPYVFISFFDHDTSHAILPLSFTPRPDNYRNIVFYFKLLNEKPNHSVSPPEFNPINRSGLTVVEISEMVD